MTGSRTEWRCSHNLQSDQHACWSAVHLRGPSLLFLMFWSNFRGQGMFLPQMLYTKPPSAKIASYWAWLIISVCENEPKSKETTVNYFQLRHHRSIEGYTRESRESVNQYSRIVWASLISSFEVARYDCLLHCFPQHFNLLWYA